jgi:hypothetical protein
MNQQITAVMDRPAGALRERNAPVSISQCTDLRAGVKRTQLLVDRSGRRLVDGGAL